MLPGWFDMHDLDDFEDTPNTDALVRNKEFVHELIANESKILGDSKKVILGGFA